ncbi:hypothetical protein [Agrococcus sp. DT81.2]|uniref:hypothetical protein n=1 Tax=Agrococcus sp. DT81.2 TaxID=3393414 RepID=UPI003CE4BDE3
MAVDPENGPMPTRPFRIPDRIYFAAKERAEEEGTTLSSIVRNALDDYAHKPRVEQPEPMTPKQMAEEVMRAIRAIG